MSQKFLVNNSLHVESVLHSLSGEIRCTTLPDRDSERPPRAYLTLPVDLLAAILANESAKIALEDVPGVIWRLLKMAQVADCSPVDLPALLEHWEAQCYCSECETAPCSCHNDDDV